MTVVQIYVLQTPKVLLDGQLVTFPYKKAEALLYYMAVEKTVTRDQAATLLWDSCDEATARKNLRHALYTIRKLFKTDLVIPSRQVLELSPEIDFQVDYDQFMEAEEKDDFHEVFLDGFFVKQTYLYEEWLTKKRSQIKDICLRRILNKMQYDKGMPVTRAEALFEKYTNEDPLDERVYRRMMEIYEENRLYYKGIRLYQQLSGLMSTELQVSPQKEIRELYQSMLRVWTEESGKSEKAEEETIAGRDKELRILRSVYRQFLSGNAVSVLLTGENGIGKTYLANYFLREISEEIGIVLSVSCLESEKHIVLWPWNMIMMQIHSYIKRHRIRLDEKYLHAADYLFPMFDTEDMREKSVGEMGISYSYRAVRNLIVKMFEELGEQIPVVLFIDNIQFMDSYSMEFLSLLIRSKNRNVMFLGTCQSIMPKDLRQVMYPLLKENQIQVIELEPFGKNDVRKILDGSLAKEAMNEKILETVYEETSGNALYLTSLLECYKKGGLEKENRSSLYEVWNKRISDLSLHAHQVLELVSCCQAWADVKSLVFILKEDELCILDALEELKSRHFLCEKSDNGEIRFYFCHESMKNYVHSQLAESRRRFFHNKLAEYIEMQENYEKNRYERLIYHYSHSNHTENLLKYKILALKDYTYSFYELYPLYLETDDREKGKEESILEYCKKLEEELLELVRKNHRKKTYLQLHVKLMEAEAQFCIPQGYYEKGTECIEKALKSNELAGDDQKVKIHCLRFLIYAGLNRWEIHKLERPLKESLKICGEYGLEEELAITRRLYGLYLSMKGEYGESMKYLEQALGFFRKAPLKTRVYALNIGACYNYMGEIMRKQELFSMAGRYYRMAIDVCRENHCPCNAVFYSNLGRSLIGEGARKEGEASFYQADQIYCESYTMIGRSITKGYLSIVEAKKGYYQNAKEYLREAQESARQFGSPYAIGMLALTEAELLERFPQIFENDLEKSVENYREYAAECLKDIPGAYELNNFFI